jgi:hypothetical protein
VPDRERRRQGHGEDGGGDGQRHPEVVDEVVGGERADDADEDDGRPVDGRDVAPGPELEEQRRGQPHAHHQRGAGQPQADVAVEEVGGGLAHGGRQDLDDPEEERDFWNLVEHASGRGGVAAERRGRRHGRQSGAQAMSNQ